MEEEQVRARIEELVYWCVKSIMNGEGFKYEVLLRSFRPLS